MKTVYVVTDLGPGDGGKGTVVHSLCQVVDAAIVIKRGGAQGSHGVHTSQGESFNFSQWGCGTLEGIPTYCSPQMTLSPVGLANESDALKHHGIYDPFMMISASPNCICSTPYHMISSQLEELSLGKNPRGTIGTGVGQAYRMHQKFGSMITIYASDLKDRSTIQRKIQMQKDYYRDLYRNMNRDNGIAADASLIAENLDLLYDDGLEDYTLSLFEDVGKKLQLKDLSEIIQMNGNAVVECSHGVLTDSQIGFKPHVSAIRTLPSFTNNMLRDAGFTGEIVNLGVHRAYEIRHGAGPMPTYDPEFTSDMLPGGHKDTNRWQGEVRAGPLDIEFLQYAVSACSDINFDGICLTWFDQILKSQQWKICKSHSPSKYIGYSVIGMNYNEIFSFVNEIVMKYVGIPLRLLSLGPTEKHKIIKLGGNDHG